ncbi:methionine--tRNA ligase [Candidatus Peregrinibacteria bacterium]|nr:methionine--tRNA ligase [Candidatus Peregrinibacteria bacterium]
MMINDYYITTTLPYVNSDPHIGFALEIIQADAIARYQRLQGKEVTFNTGTDEHGLKIFRKAEERGISAQEFCDEYAAKFDDLKEALNLSYTQFIRTTDEHHIAAAQEFWKRCDANGDIYKKQYKVKYCVGCELEKTESALEDGKCPMHPNLEIEIIEEENYFFKYSRYEEALLKLYKEQPDFVLPRHRLTEIANFTEKGLEDFSISRLKEKMPWGVPVPGDEEHVMYVWFDALINYISTLGWPEDEANFEKLWPGWQIAGKDNLRQQSSMWQSMLLSAGLKPSAQILIHGFMTAEGKKMSKSLGNVVDPFEAVKIYGIDALRFYLLKDIPTAEDGDFNKERFKINYDSDLANNLGNLVSRVIAMTVKYFDGKVPEMCAPKLTLEHLERKWGEIDDGMTNFDIKKAVEGVWSMLDSGNRYVEEEKPWQLAKEGNEAKLKEVMYVLLEGLRQASWMIEPYMPEAAAKIRTQLGANEDESEGLALREWGRLKPGTQVEKSEPLFPRSEE